MECVVYCLRDPNTKNIFYVGATGNPMKRKSDHLKSNRNKLKSIDRLIGRGCNPLFEVLEFADNSILGERELFWMKKLRIEGHKLENKIMQGNKRATKYNHIYNIRTTKSIYNTLKEESGVRGISMNELINEILVEECKEG